MTAEELKQIFGRAVPDRGKLQEIRLRAGKPVLVFMDGRESVSYTHLTLPTIA